MRLFVDTGAWFALNSRTDRNHAAAAAFCQRFRGEGVLFHTTDYVVGEIVTLLRCKISHRQAVQFLDFLSNSPSVLVLPASEKLLKQAETIFRKYKDKRWSFTDCVSFAAMDELDLDSAFAFGANFQQYGKRVLP